MQLLFGVLFACGSSAPNALDLLRFFLLQRQRRRNGAMRNTNTHSNQTANYVNHFSAFLHRHSGDVEVAATAGTAAATRRSIVSGIGHYWMEKCSSTMHVSAVHKSDRQRMPNACTYLFVFHLGAVSAKHSNIKRRNCRRESFSQLAIQVDSRIPWHERREIETEAHSSSQTKRTKCKANAMCSKNSAHSCIIYELRNRFVCFEYNCERIYCYWLWNAIVQRLFFLFLFFFVFSPVGFVLFLSVFGVLFVVVVCFSVWLFIVIVNARWFWAGLLLGARMQMQQSYLWLAKTTTYSGAVEIASAISSRSRKWDPHQLSTWLAIKSDRSHEKKIVQRIYAKFIAVATKCSALDIHSRTDPSQFQICHACPVSNCLSICCNDRSRPRNFTTKSEKTQYYNDKPIRRTEANKNEWANDAAFVRAYTKCHCTAPALLHNDVQCTFY